MPEFVFTNDFTLVVHSNKNASLFKIASQNIINDSSEKPKGIFGIYYDDFDPSNNITNKWKQTYDNINIMKISPRKKTLRMDDKILFAKYMKDSPYIPLHYNSKDDIIQEHEKDLFFVKHRGSTGGKGVTCVPYSKLNNTTDCVIQKSINNPHLFENRRYKSRVYVSIFNKKVFLYKHAWASLALVDFSNDVDSDNAKLLNDMHIIYQCANRRFFELNEVDNFDKIFDSIKKSCCSFIKSFKNEINSIDGNEFCILGFDYIFDDDFNAQIIEINHRSNYSHPKNVLDTVDIPALQDTIKLLINNSCDNTDYIEIKETDEEIKLIIEECD